MLAPQFTKKFRLHGIAVELRGKGAESLIRDFDFFADRPAGKHNERYSVSLELLPRAPEPSDLPETPAERVFPDCVMYRDGANNLTYEYPGAHGGAVLSVARSGNASLGRLVSTDTALAEELGYLYLQSEIGRFLDAQGLHRVHALGLGLPNGSSALVLLPSGGGKSTLALEALQHGGCQLLSDDTPLVDRFGNVHPYPLRLSFRKDAKIPEDWKKHSSVFERRKHGAKLLVPTAALPAHCLPRPDERFRPGFLVLARRHGSRRHATLTEISRLKSAGPMLRDLVVGLGVPQVAELILTRGALSLPGLAPTAASRLAAASAFLARSKSLRLDLSRDPVANARFLLDHLTGSQKVAKP